MLFWRRNSFEKKLAWLALGSHFTYSSCLYRNVRVSSLSSVITPFSLVTLVLVSSRRESVIDDSEMQRCWGRAQCRVCWRMMRMSWLITVINRRMMKILIALALIAYIACEYMTLTDTLPWDEACTAAMLLLDCENVTFGCCNLETPKSHEL